MQRHNFAIGYCAPEVLYREIVSHRCDVWSFAMTVFTMVAGK